MVKNIKFSLSDLFIYKTYNNPCEKNGLGFGTIFKEDFRDKKFIYLADKVKAVKNGQIQLGNIENDKFQIIMKRLEYFIEDPRKIYQVNDHDPIKAKVENRTAYLREGYHRAIALYLLGKREIEAEITNK